MKKVGKKIFGKIYQLVKKIPAGKVATYGMIAKKVGTSPRVVGWTLHQNPDPVKIPCHRVVGKDGRLTKAFAFGGEAKQRKRLVGEGVAFVDITHVDLKKHLWETTNTY